MKTPKTRTGADAALASDLKRHRKGVQSATEQKKAMESAGCGRFIGLHPHNFTRIEVSESTFYEIAIFALRYAMGGGTISRESVIGDIISAVGFSNLSKRIASCFCADFERYLDERVRIWKETGKVSDTWMQCYEWFKAIRDDAFSVVHCEGKVRGKLLKEDHLCFKHGGRWIDAVSFRSNTSAVMYVDEEFVKSSAPVRWEEYLSERTGAGK